MIAYSMQVVSFSISAMLICPRHHGIRPRIENPTNVPLQQYFLWSETMQLCLSFCTLTFALAELKGVILREGFRSGEFY